MTIMTLRDLNDDCGKFKDKPQVHCMSNSDSFDITLSLSSGFMWTQS